jgi:hypothetical protein
VIATGVQPPVMSSDDDDDDNHNAGICLNAKGWIMHAYWFVLPAGQLVYFMFFVTDKSWSKASHPSLVPHQRKR